MTDDTRPLPAPAVRRRIPKWPFALLGILLATGLTVVLIYPLRVNYVAFGPGTVEEVDGFIDVGAETFGAEGELSFLTITSNEVNVFEYIEAVFDDEVDLTERRRVRPDDVSREEQDRRNLASMQESQRAAAYAALTRLGYEPIGDGALITDLISDSPAIAVFDIGDIIVAVNGEPVTLADEAVDMVSTIGPGETLQLTVRHGEDGPIEDLDVTLATHPDDPDRGFIGVFLTTAIEFPIDVDIMSGNIGGPSAGVMWALGVMNLLTEEDLTKGHRVAGTGAIDFDGDVRGIGGVRQKIFAAMAGGVEYALVPDENLEDALSAADRDRIHVVGIDTIDDALAFLDSLDHAERFAAP